MNAIAETLTAGEYGADAAWASGAPGKCADAAWASGAPEKCAPWARLADFDTAPVDKPARTLIAWEGEAWAEIDPDTGCVLARGTVGRD